MRPPTRLVIALVVCGVHAFAEVKLVQEYLLKPPRDPKILFAMTVTPEQDVLSFVASQNDHWRLSRVRGWLDQQLAEETLNIPAFGPGAWGNLGTRLLVTPDGRFAICIATALAGASPWGYDDVISVVSLADFKLVSTIRASENEFVKGHGYRIYGFDRSGSLSADANEPLPRHPGDDPFVGGHHRKLTRLLLPELTVTNHCEFSEWMNTGVVVRRENENNCASLLGDAHASSLADYFLSSIATDEATQSNDRARPGNCTFLTYSSTISRDGRLRRELCTDGHRGFWGNFVVSHARENIFSAETGQHLGSIDEPSDHRLQWRFATTDRGDFLLSMEGGTRLRVYRVTN
jgi:hypothetical protein